jgi:hypothetical protein
MYILYSFISHDDLALYVRLVCRQFRNNATALLNNNFLKLEKRIEHALMETHAYLFDINHKHFETASTAHHYMQLVRSDVSYAYIV